MPTFVLTWNPDRWQWPGDDYEDAVRTTASGGHESGRWSVGIRSGGIAIGDRAFLLRQRHERGIVASGRFTSEIVNGPHWDGSGEETTYAQVEWDMVVDPDNRLPVEVLNSEVSEVHWDRLQGSGVEISADAAFKVEQLWESLTEHSRTEGHASAFDFGGLRLLPGQRVRRRDELHKAVGGQQQGGISTPAGFPIVLAFTGATGAEFGYEDSWEDDNRALRFYGEGQRGDMRFIAGNVAIRDHEQNGKELHLFEGRGDGWVTYRGQVRCASAEIVPEAPDADGNPRDAIVFRLVPIELDRSAWPAKLISSVASASEELDDMVRGRRGQGYGLSASERRAVEHHAMGIIRTKYQAEGWTVLDVYATKSYDLKATRRDEELHIEVKGTTGGLDMVLLTKNEVRWNRDHPENSVLAVVHTIALDRAKNPAVAAGGILHEARPWVIADSALEALAFRYSIPLP